MVLDNPGLTLKNFLKKLEFKDLVFSLAFSAYVFFLLIPAPQREEKLILWHLVLWGVVALSSGWLKKYWMGLLPALAVLIAMSQTDSRAVFGLYSLLFFFSLGFSLIRKNRSLTLFLLVVLSNHLIVFFVDAAQFFVRNGILLGRGHLISRFGRQYSSIAIALFVIVSLLLSAKRQSLSSFASGTSKYLAAIGAVLLFYVDSRASLLALGLTVLLILKVYPTDFDWLIERFRRLKTNRRAFLLLICFLALMVRFNDRYLRLWPTVQASLFSKDNLSWIDSRRFHDSFCNEIECTVDESIFLRLSWLRFGLSQAMTNPWGIGENERALEYLLKKSYADQVVPQLVYDNFHNQFLNLTIQYGVYLIVPIATALIFLFIRTRQTIQGSDPQGILAAAYFISLFFTLRCFIDACSEGLWFVYMSFLGLLLSLLLQRTFLHGRN